MGFLEKYFGVKKKDALAVIPSANTVIVKGELHFEIFEDGNGYFRAKHKSKDWLDGAYGNPRLTSFYEHGERYRTIEKCQQDCMTYIKSQQITKVGTIEFIPSHNE